MNSAYMIREKLDAFRHFVARGVEHLSVNTKLSLSPEERKRLLNMAIGNIVPADVEWYIQRQVEECTTPELLATEEPVNQAVREEVEQSVRKDLEHLTQEEQNIKIQRWAYEKGQKIGLIRSEPK